MTKMGSVIGHGIDYNGVGVRRGQWHIPSKNWPKYPPPPGLQSLAYNTLADLVHHVRTRLPLPHLSLAGHMFSKNVHDDSLLVSIQTMPCNVGCKYSSKVCKWEPNLYLHSDSESWGSNLVEIVLDSTLFWQTILYNILWHDVLHCIW